MNTFKFSMRVILFTGAMMAALVCHGCIRRIKVSEISMSPDAFTGKIVTVNGVVEKSYGTNGDFVYQLLDESGDIWVHTAHPTVPANGSRVIVKGKIVNKMFVSQKYPTKGMEEISRRQQ